MTISPQRVAWIAAIRDEDIDTSDIPEVGEEFFVKARRRRPMSITAPAWLIVLVLVYFFVVNYADVKFGTLEMLADIGVIESPYYTGEEE